MIRFTLKIQANEDNLGKILGALPHGIIPEITRFKEKPSKQEKMPVAKTGKRIDKAIQALQHLPDQFDGTQFRTSIEAFGLAPISANYWLDKLHEQKLIRKTGAGSGMKYHKIKT